MRDKKSIILYLIRHGEAAKAWEEDPNPGLSQKGQNQSEIVAHQLVPILKSSNFQVISSPLLRAQQTLIPLKAQFDFQPSIQSAFAEIPSPGIALTERRNWLKAIFNKKISELEAPQIAWRQELLTTFQQLNQPTLIFSHFMTINSIVGWVQQSEQVVSFYPDTCSITKIERIGEQYFIKKLGRQLETVVQ